MDNLSGFLGHFEPQTFVDGHRFEAKKVQISRQFLRRIRTLRQGTKNYPPQDPNHNETGQHPQLRAMARRLMEFSEGYASYFNVARRNVSKQARHYLYGLLQKAPRKNMERMEEYVEGSDYQSQQQFLSDSPWDAQALQDRVARDASGLLGGEESALLIDESAFEKNGDKSAGVARQWNGRLDKVDNVQVGVFAALSDGHGGTLIDGRLYLPESWCEDPERCRKVKIPAGWTILSIQTATGVGDDRAGSGERREVWLGGFRRLLRFHSVASPSGGRQRKSFRGRRAQQCEPLSERSRALSPPARESPRTPAQRIAGAHRGLLDGRFLYGSRRRRVASRRHPRRKQRHDPGRRLRPPGLVLERRGKAGALLVGVCVIDEASGDTKFFVSNAPSDTPLEELVRKHAVRFWIERGFQDAKTSLGMADYQARGWSAWNHHMGMIMLAMHFLLRERRVHLVEIELLSCQDIVELLNVLLPRRDATPEAIINQIEIRQLKRRDSILSARMSAQRRYLKRLASENQMSPEFTSGWNNEECLI